MTRLPRTSNTTNIIAALAALAIYSGGIIQAQETPPPPAVAAPPSPGITESDDATPPSADVSPSNDVTPPPADGAAAEEQDGVEVLTHGPVHEAFAQPMSEDMEDGLVVPEAPPEPIDELPPEYMPEGDNVEWIPGYWAWDSDEDHEGYVWVSGLWRNVPPGQQWVPGHWTEADGGYRWIAGFWTGQQTADLNYLPYPPASLGQGPNVAAPNDNSFWVPGSWIYQSNNYQWQPGYWAPGYDNWCWVPQRYVWTPNGALYSSGYWDYRLPYRGLLFAPVRFRNRSLLRRRSPLCSVRRHQSGGTAGEPVHPAKIQPLLLWKLLRKSVPESRISAVVQPVVWRTISL